MIALLALWALAASAPLWLAIAWRACTLAREVVRCVRDARYSCEARYTCHYPCSGALERLACHWARRTVWYGLACYARVSCVLDPMRAIRREYTIAWCTI